MLSRLRMPTLATGLFKVDVHYTCLFFHPFQVRDGISLDAFSFDTVAASYAKVAIECVAADQEDRPSMDDVVQRLLSIQSELLHQEATSSIAGNVMRQFFFQLAIR